MRNRIKYNIRNGNIRLSVTFTVESDSGDTIDERYALLLQDFGKQIIKLSKDYAINTTLPLIT